MARTNQAAQGNAPTGLPLASNMRTPPTKQLQAERNAATFKERTHDKYKTENGATLSKHVSYKLLHIIV